MITQTLLSTAETSQPSFFCNVNLHDSRLNVRLNQIQADLEKSPAQSFPLIFHQKKDLAAFYRFVNNERVSSSELIGGMTFRTVEKVCCSSSEGKDVLAIHDTTAFDFTRHAPFIEGLGRLTSGKKGFFGHFCIASTPQREILGLLGLMTWTRKGQLKKRTRKRKNKQPSDGQSESLRWPQMIQEVQNQFANTSASAAIIHVADREVDDYDSFCDLVQRGGRFVFRVKYNRNILDQRFPKLFDSLREAQATFHKEVKISPRKAKTQRSRDQKDHPPRNQRVAKLAVAAKTIEVCAPREAAEVHPRTLKLNFVRVFEIEVPEGEKPIEWMLLSSEPIQNEQDLQKIVDIYRCRWIIEEYFHALKTGCEFEERELESLDGLIRCLVLFAPIACQLYNLKIWARDQPERSAQSLVTEAQLRILETKTHKKREELTTAKNLMLAIAALGGHLKHNGLPGWKVLARGFEKLLKLEEGYLLALRSFAICVE